MPMVRPKEVKASQFCGFPDWRSSSGTTYTTSLLGETAQFQLCLIVNIGSNTPTELHIPGPERPETTRATHITTSARHSPPMHLDPRGRPRYARRDNLLPSADVSYSVGHRGSHERSRRPTRLWESAHVARSGTGHAGSEHA